MRAREVMVVRSTVIIATRMCRPWPGSRRGTWDRREMGMRRKKRLTLCCLRERGSERDKERDREREEEEEEDAVRACMGARACVRACVRGALRDPKASNACAALFHTSICPPAPLFSASPSPPSDLERQRRRRPRAAATEGGAALAPQSPEDDRVGEVTGLGFRRRCGASLGPPLRPVTPSTVNIRTREAIEVLALCLYHK